MGRRRVLSNMPKMVLPTVSWVALMSLLKKAPKNFPSSGSGIAAEMAMKLLVGCRATPQTDSLRYADDYVFARTKDRRRGSGKRPKTTGMLDSIMGGCSSRPHTDSFRVHHVVNQEALQLMLTVGDDDGDGADFEQEFFDSEELWYGIIRDGDRLLHDDVYADDSTRASSSMRTCSSSLSASVSRSVMTSCSGGTALSRNSVDSEGFYSTATSASFDRAQSSGSHVSGDSRPSSNSMASSCGALELVFGDANLDHDLKILEAGEEMETEAEEEKKQPDKYNTDQVDADRDFCAQDDQDDLRDDNYPASTSCTHTSEYGGRLSAGRRSSYEEDDEVGLHESHELGDAEEEEEEEEIVAEMRYSEDPLEDFVEAISRMVVKQQLNKAAELQELYWRFLRLNAPSHHRTITLAFLYALQRLASFEPHDLLHTFL